MLTKYSQIPSYICIVEGEPETLTNFNTSLTSNQVLQNYSNTVTKYIPLTSTPTVTPTNTITPTVTPTNTITPTNTPTVTPTNTQTPTYTPTNTQTPTYTPTVTPTPPTRYILAQSGDILTAQNGDGIEYQH